MIWTHDFWLNYSNSTNSNYSELRWLSCLSCSHYTSGLDSMPKAWSELCRYVVYLPWTEWALQRRLSSSLMNLTSWSIEVFWSLIECPQSAWRLKQGQESVWLLKEFKQKQFERFWTLWTCHGFTASLFEDFVEQFEVLSASQERWLQDAADLEQPEQSKSGGNFKGTQKKE